MIKIEYIMNKNSLEFQKSINKFIKNKIIKDIKFTVNDGYNYALIIYEEYNYF